MSYESFFFPVLTGVAVVGAASLLLVVEMRRRKRNKLIHDLDSRDLRGKTAIVTGANTGIGFWTAQDLAARHARVILACRSLERGEEACKKIIAATGNSDVHVRHVDLLDFSTVRQFADQIVQSEQRLDILVNNAGLYVGSLPEVELRREDGLDVTLTVNHLGPYLLTRLLMDLLKSSAPSRIVNVSSEAQIMVRGNFDMDALRGKKALSPFSAYAHSKLANLLFTRCLAQRLENSGVQVYCVHPGVVATEIWRNLSPAMDIIIRTIFFFRMQKPEVGAETSIYVCVADDKKLQSGKYYVDCQLAEGSVNTLANDVVLQRTLWDVSAQLTGVTTEMD